MLGIRPAVAARFESSQSPSESHKALSLALKQDHLAALQINGGKEEFIASFVQCVDRTVVLPRTDLTSQRVRDFVVLYASMVVDDGDAFQDFVDTLIEHYAAFIEHKLVAVRYNCVKLVAQLLQYSAILDDVYDNIVDKLIGRLRDSDAYVRKESALSLCSFESSPAINAALVNTMEHDPSSDVRLVVTYNKGHDEAYIGAVLGRMRDSAPSLRRMLFSKVLRSFQCETVSIKTRVQIIMCGLKDSNESVRKAAKALISSWISAANNDIPQVLKSLDPVVNTEAADLVLNALFELRSDVFESIALSSFNFENWGPQDVLILRGFQEFCIKNGLHRELDAMPELYVLANEIEKLVDQSLEDHSYNEMVDPLELAENLPFMIEQLLYVASRYDVDDESGRQRLSEVTNRIVVSPEAQTGEIIKHIVTIQRRLNASSNHAFVSWAFETLSAIQPSLTQEVATQTEVTDMLRAVVLFKYVLSLVSSRDVVEFLPSLFDEYISTPLNSPVYDIRVPALECLALACLLDDKFAELHYEVLWRAAMKATEDVNEEDDLLIREITSGVSALTDLILNTEKSMHAPAQDKDGADSSQILSQLGDVTTEPEEEHAAEFPYSQLESTIELLETCLQNRSLKVQSLASFNLSKLVLSGRIIEEEEVLQRLLQLYFENEPRQVESDDAGLMQQRLSLFLHAYTTFDKGKLAVARVFRGVCTDFLRVKASGRLSITLGDVFVHLLNLTVPHRDLKADTASAHALIASNLLEWLFFTDNASQRRSAANALANVVLESTSFESITEMLLYVNARADELESMSAAIRNLVIAFRDRLQAVSDLRRVENLNISEPPEPISEPSMESFVEV